MKRFALVALLAAMLFGVASVASATEMKVKGSFEVGAEWSANLGDFDSETADNDNQYLAQRVRTFFTFLANENLKAVLGLEIDNVWGAGDTDWGTDVNEDVNGGGAIEVKHAYLDFNFPDTAINVKAGLQTVSLPSVFGNPVFDEDAPAVLVSAPINDMFGITLGYTRGEDNLYYGEGNSSLNNDETDGVMLIAPITLDGLSITPYAVYAWVGKDTENLGLNPNGLWSSERPEKLADTLDQDIALTDDATAWWLGVNAELTMFDPITVAADLIYGSMEGEVAGADLDQDGWFAALAASYKMDVVTPTLFMVYSTGIDEDTFDGNDIDLDTMPSLAEGFELTPFIGGGRALSYENDEYLVGNAQGVWAMGLTLANINFVENLTHDLTIAYARGTSDDWEDTGVEFDEDASAWELYMVNKYMIYENLAAINELGYFAPNFDVDNKEDDAAYFATVGFQYKF